MLFVLINAVACIISIQSYADENVSKSSSLEIIYFKKIIKNINHNNF